MKKEETLSDPLERMILETLKEKPRPKLSADFALDVVERVERAERKREVIHKAGAILAVYWAVVIIISGFLMAGIKWPRWYSILFLALTPFVLLAAAAPRRLLRSIERVLGLEPPSICRKELRRTGLRI